MLILIIYYVSHGHQTHCGWLNVLKSSGLVVVPKAERWTEYLEDRGESCLIFFLIFEGWHIWIVYLIQQMSNLHAQNVSCENHEERMSVVYSLTHQKGQNVFHPIHFDIWDMDHPENCRETVSKNLGISLSWQLHRLVHPKPDLQVCRSQPNEIVRNWVNLDI
mgnify:CR=1 FL=1